MRYCVHIRVFGSLHEYLTVSTFYKKEEREEPERDFPYFLVFLARSSFYQ
jgi:hypothetical protein